MEYKIGEKIKKLRKSKNMTQRQLAEKMHITQSAISQFERSKTLNASTLIKIASALNVNRDELLPDIDFSEFEELQDIIYKYSTELYQTASRAKKQGAYDIIFDDALFGIAQDFICNTNQDIVNKLNQLLDNLDSFKDANNIYDGEKIRYFLRSK